MRDIKFKAKRVDNGEWVLGGYLFTQGKHLILYDYDHWSDDYSHTSEVGTPTRKVTTKTYEHSVIPETVCQYTGLKDKKGKDIYEGDLVNYAVKKKICSHCAKKEITSELEYGVTQYCPNCGNKLSDSDFITLSEVVFDRGGFAYKHNVTERSYQSWPTHVAEIYIAWAEIIGNIHNK